eukprot:TRINITY_DN122408_c0_g1_i1.p1 TRINITY_DN122408_c0_g1~~TRINITY_DN122408_c0_g1_i1.p1  ORF type:complete len:1195 (+),score=304.27 TRINITY_DN122408_c0_g1_i1:154-3738(+)
MRGWRNRGYVCWRDSTNHLVGSLSRQGSLELWRQASQACRPVSTGGGGSVGSRPPRRFCTGTGEGRRSDVALPSATLFRAPAPPAPPVVDFNAVRQDIGVQCQQSEPVPSPQPVNGLSDISSNPPQPLPPPPLNGGHALAAEQAETFVFRTGAAALRQPNAVAVEEQAAAQALQHLQPDLPTTLNQLQQATYRQVKDLQRALVQRHASGAWREHERLALERAHELLQRVGTREMRSKIRSYLWDEDMLEEDVVVAVARLDEHLFSEHSVLLEDLSESLLQRWLDDAAFLQHSLRSGELRSELYGEEKRYPILKEAPDLQELPATAWRRQFAVERHAQREALVKYQEIRQKMIEGGHPASMGSQTRVWLHWVDHMTKRIDDLKNSEGLYTGRMNKFKEMDIFVSELRMEPRAIAAICCQTLINLIYTWRKGDSREDIEAFVNENIKEEKRGLPMVVAARAVGEAVLLENSYHAVAAEDDLRGKAAASPTTTRRRVIAAQKKASAAKKLANNDGELDQVSEVIPLGAHLLDMLLDCAVVRVDASLVTEEDIAKGAKLMEKIGDTGEDVLESTKMTWIAALNHEYRWIKKKIHGWVVLNPVADKVMDLGSDDIIHMLAPKYPPMLAEPKAWQPSGRRPSAPYLMEYMPFIRTNSQGMTHLQTYRPDRVVDIMDSLGKTPWRINSTMLAYMEEAVKRDIARAKVPPREDPVPPDLPEDQTTMREEDLKLLKIERFNAIKKKNELQSDRPTFFLKLQVARDFEHAENLYFPHNVDFRGRAYPIPPHLNHISDDICRGLLHFAEKKPLGDEGFYWMKVTLANLLGKDKKPFDERAAFVDESKDWIMKVAEDPFAEDVRDHWLNASDGPWQTLARCIEVAEAWKLDDPRQFMSSQPIHLDGSCNGLQHYAALGRDPEGALAVNLSNSDRPQDVYTVVLKIVEEKVRKQAAGDGDHSDMARRIEELGVLKRKVVKRTVMTICYGVTAIGAKLQVQAELHPLIGSQVDPLELSRMATHISRLILKSIDEVFERAMKIKKWFDKVSAILNKLESPVAWLSPMGLACVQPYKKKRVVSVRSKRQSISVADKEGPLIDAFKQRLGFPPNFVHSMDASHMMLTAEGCRREGITFAGVHDSFWTHACDAPKLNRIIRSSFVELHSKPILEELYDDLTLHLGGSVDLPPLPPPGEWDINDVTDSTYIFS